MPSRQDCIDDIAKKTGRKREDVDELLSAIDARAQDYQESGGLGPDEAYMRARDETLNEIGEQAALRRREEILNTRKRALLGRYYRDTLAAIAKLPLGDATRERLARGAARIAVEAKLVGVNLPFMKNRLSVDAQYVALRHLWLDEGLGRDLEQGGLLKIFASRAVQDNWVRELFTLNRGGAGDKPVTGDAQALAIAKIVQKWQKESMAAINAEGGWVRSYLGFVTHTSHDPDKIRRVGVAAWAAKTLPRLDLKQTFGSADRQRVLDALHAMYDPLVKGDHFDYGRPVDEPLYPSVAAKASAERILHFKSADDWLAYNKEFGVADPTLTVVSALRLAARRTALMREFGTRPRETFAGMLGNIRAQLQAESRGALSKLSALQGRLESPGLDATLKAKIEGDIAALKPGLDAAQARFEDFRKYAGDGKTVGFLGVPAENRFAQIDGTAAMPVNHGHARAVAGWMAIQRMSKLGRVVFTHFASLPTATIASRYWGIPLSKRFASIFSGFTRGAEGSEKRQVADLMGVGLEARLGQMMSTYDVADAPHGLLAKWESRFFKLTGVSSVTENQRAEHEQMLAAHLGSKRDLEWAAIGRKEQRALTGYGIGEAEWQALRQAEWTKVGDRTFLFPSDAHKLSDDAIRSYLASQPEGAGFGLGKYNPAKAEDLDRARGDLALKVAAAYSDSAGYAVPMPSARIRAIMFQNAYAPGTPLNTALRLVYQFKMWPADMILRTWGREIYGSIGDGQMDRVAGVAEMLAGMTVFGVAAEAAREAVEGKDPTAEMREKPFGYLLRGLQRSGFGSIFGDFLLGEYDRHGFTPLQQLAGPTVPDIDLLTDMLWAGNVGQRHGALSPQAWRERASDTLQFAKNNTPFMNLWMSGLGLDTLVWHRLQEWLSPGYLKRSEQRQAQQNGTHFWLSPAATDQWLTGSRPAVTPNGGWNLGAP
jgi:hypothetical protein